MIRSFFLLLLTVILFFPNSMTGQIDHVSEKELSTQKVFIEATQKRILEDYDEAVKLFKKILDKDKKNHAAAYELARTYVADKKKDKAVEFAEKAFSIDPANLWYGLLYADLLEDEGNYKTAGIVYSRLIETNPNNDDLYFDLAYMHKRTGKYDSAIKIYNKLEKKYGVNEETSMLKHGTYSLMKKPEKAAGELEKLSIAFPAELTYKHRLADYYKKNKMGDKAQKLYEDILKINPQDGRANIALAESFKSNGQDLEYLKAVQPLFKNPQANIDVKVRELYPYIQKVSTTNDPELKNILFESAKGIAEAHPGEAKAFSLYGDLLYQGGKSEEALKQYQKALKLNKKVFSVWEQVMYISAETGNASQLIKTSEEAMDFFPNQPMNYYLNGIGHSMNKDHKTAVESLKQALMMSGKNKKLQRRIYTQLGSTYNSLKKFDKSNESFESALKLNPKDAYTLNNYSYYLALRGEELDKAKEMSMLSNELSPNNPSYLDTYGWILYKQKNYSGAKKQLSKAMKAGGSESPEILEHYGDVLFQLDEVNDAVIYWQKAQKNGSKSDLLEKKISNRKLFE